MDGPQLLAVMRRMVREERGTPAAGFDQTIVLPGTVTTGGLPGTSVEVRLDSDQASRGVFNATGRLLVANQRVYVSLIPPHGATVTGIISSGPWVAWVPVVSASVGTITTIGTVEAFYDKSGRTVRWRADIPITTNGAGASSLVFTLPFVVAGTAAVQFIGAGRERLVTGTMLQVYTAAGSAAAFVNTYNNLYPAGDGYALALAGQYEATT